MEKKLLSIIIPTKNRYQYLKPCIEQLEKLNLRDTEIIINDNSDDNTEFIDVIKRIQININYFYTREKLSQTENSEQALLKSTGEYVCFLGDDDSINGNIIYFVSQMKKYNIDSLSSNVARYFWPDVVLPRKKEMLTFYNSKTKIKKINAQKLLIKKLKIGLQDIRKMPRVYHSIISRKALDIIKDRTGFYFPGPSPDMANAVASCLTVNNHFYTNYPIIISGFGYNSAGGMGLRGEHKGTLKNSKQLPINVEEKWKKEIPKLWLGYTMWAESGIEALESLRENNYVKKMNYYAMYARIYLKYKKEYKNEVFHYLDTFTKKIHFFYEVIKLMIFYIINLLKYKLTINKLYRNYNKISFFDACDIINSKTSKNINYNKINKKIEKEIKK